MVPAAVDLQGAGRWKGLVLACSVRGVGVVLLKALAVWGTYIYIHYIYFKVSGYDNKPYGQWLSPTGDVLRGGHTR